MSKYAVDRTITYQQFDTVVVEAKSATAAIKLARQQEEPEFNWEFVERARRYDRCENVRLANSTMTSNEIFRKNLRRTREAQGLTLRVLAEKAGIGASHIHSIEKGTTHGNITIETAQRLADGLGVSVASMMEIHQKEAA